VAAEAMKIFLVGGAVRDTLMGLEPKDLDYVVVGSSVEEMLSLGFQQVGADFPVFLHPVTGYEYALARKERKTGPGYLGFEVETEHVTLCDDLERRDLTINSMAMDENGVLYDPFNGQNDLKNRILRHTSPAFVEDPLRVIRLARFYARYNFEIAKETFDLIRKIIVQGHLNELATERFWAELTKVFQETRPDLFFELMYCIRGDTHVSFFSCLYGNFKRLDNAYPDFIKKVALAVGFARPDERVMLHVALTAIPGRILETADNRTRTLHANVQRASNIKKMDDLTADTLFDLLKHAKAWSDGTAVEDLWKAIIFGNNAGMFFQLPPSMLLGAVEVTKKITSADYMIQYGPGKDLGAAIERGRKEALMQFMETHGSTS
jgi:hypothetical protein